MTDRAKTVSDLPLLANVNANDYLLIVDSINVSTKRVTANVLSRDLPKLHGNVYVESAASNVVLTSNGMNNIVITNFTTNTYSSALFIIQATDEATNHRTFGEVLVTFTPNFDNVATNGAILSLGDANGVITFESNLVSNNTVLEFSFHRTQTGPNIISNVHLNYTKKIFYK